MPQIKIIPETNSCFLNCISQYPKNNKLIISNIGRNSVKTDKTGNNFGARNGKVYPTIVKIAKMILKKKAILLNKERFFILCKFQAYGFYKLIFQIYKKFSSNLIS